MADKTFNKQPNSDDIGFVYVYHNTSLNNKNTIVRITLEKILKTNPKTRYILLVIICLGLHVIYFYLIKVFHDAYWKNSI